MPLHRDQKKALKSNLTAETQLRVLWVSLKTLVFGLIHYARFLWQHNPLRVISQRQRRLYFVESYGESMIKPRLKEKILDVFLSDHRRRQRLLRWVHARTRNPDVVDFSHSWQDGLALCALLESLCPGVCPSYHLLSHLNRVKNCRLGIKLANKYLYVPMDLISPEEMAIANKSSENKIIQYISMLRWASENIKDKWSSIHESLIAAKSGRCFAKGSGLRNGIVGKRSKFTIIVSDTIGVFNMLVEVRGPNSEYCGERLVSLHQAKGVLDKSFDVNKTYSDTIKYLEDGAGNTYVRKKVPPRYELDSGDTIHLDFQCGEEGTFYVTYVPRRAGLHAVAVKWQNHHVENSPFRIKVYKASNVSSKNLKGAQEKRVIYDSLSFTTFGTTGSQESLDNLDVREDCGAMETGSPGERSAAAVAKSKAYSTGRQLTVTRRRVLRRIITRNGEDIVIEEAISPSMSRQSSITDNSDDDNRGYRREREDKRMSTNICTTPRAHSPCHTPNTTAGSLRTVPEERQNSKEDNTANINKQTTPDNEDTNNPSKKLDTSPLQEHTENAIIFRASGNDRNEVTPRENFPNSRRNSKVKDVGGDEPVDTILETDNDEYLGEKAVGEEKVNSTKTPETWFNFGVFNDTSAHKAKMPLKRTISMHRYPDKSLARRTTSDGPLYQLRKRAVSLTSSDKSETASEISSDDKTSVFEDDGVTSSPNLKVLHSRSLRKACMYISDKAFSGTMSSLGEDGAVFHESCDVINTPKTRLRATKSLPIMRKIWQTEGEGSWLPVSTDFGSSFGEMEPSATISNGLKRADYTNRESRGISLDGLENFITVDAEGNVNVSRFNFVSEVGERERLQSQAEIHAEMCSVNGYYYPDPDNDSDKHTADEKILSDPCYTNDCKAICNHSDVNPGTFSLGGDHQNDAETFEEVFKELESLTSPKSEPSRRHSSSKYANAPLPDGKHGTKHRRSLTRQWTVFGNRSSGDSSSDTSKKSTKNEKCISSSFSLDTSSVLKFEFKPVFHGTNMPSKTDKGKDSTGEVLIVTPKAKVDKSTQVSEDEIKKETGWDVIEGMYLLLRKISIKVPYTPNVDTETQPMSITTQECLKLTHTDNDDSMEIETIDKPDMVYPVSTNEGLGEEHANSDGVTGNAGNDIAVNVTEHAGNVRTRKINQRVDSWLENNSLSLTDDVGLSPMRQLTAETNDSGFDDNPTFNRQARFSLPSLRSVNGHVRLHRRPYKGQILLDRKLVVSSSQSMSLELRELGHEADDELMHNSSLEAQSKQQRRRHKLKYRQESVSMSDSEINQRRQTNRRKVFHSKRYPARAACAINNRRARLVDLAQCNSDEERNDIVEKDISMRDKQGDQVKDETKMFGAENDSSKRRQSDDDKYEENEPLGYLPTTYQKNVKTALFLRKSRSSTKSSSMDSNYCGFGISKRGRDVLVSQLGDFQSLFPTEEVPNEELYTLENPPYLGQNGEEIDQVAATGESICYEDKVFEAVNEDKELSDNSSLKVRSQSWDGILSENADMQEQAEIESTPETSMSHLGSDSGSDDIMDRIQALGTDAAFDMFSSFDHSHMNDVLPRQSSTSCLDHDDVTADCDDSDDTTRTVVKVAGVGHKHGQVGSSNAFQVWIENPSAGSLSVNVIGPRPHTVTETSIIYTGDNLYGPRHAKRDLRTILTHRQKTRENVRERSSTSNILCRSIRV